MAVPMYTLGNLVAASMVSTTQGVPMCDSTNPMSGNSVAALAMAFG